MQEEVESLSFVGTPFPTPVILLEIVPQIFVLKPSLVFLTLGRNAGALLIQGQLPS